MTVAPHPWPEFEANERPLLRLLHVASVCLCYELPRDADPDHQMRLTRVTVHLDDRGELDDDQKGSVTEWAMGRFGLPGQAVHLISNGREHV